MYKNKSVRLGIFILLVVVAIYFLISKKSSFGVSQLDITGFVSGLAAGTSEYSTSANTTTGKAPAALKWETLFLPSRTNQTKYNEFLFCDPGWYQPNPLSSGTNAAQATLAEKYSNVDGHNILGANVQVPSKQSPTSLAGSVSSTSVFTPIIGWAGSKHITDQEAKKFYSSSTSLSAIPNSYIYASASTATLTTPLTVTDGYYTRICPSNQTSSGKLTGPHGSCGEYGAFNAYFQCDLYASSFMNNNTQFSPFTITAPTSPPNTSPYATAIPDINLLTNVTTYSGTNTKTIGTMSANSTISYNDVMGIPADAIFNNTIDYKGGYTTTLGTPGETMSSRRNTTGQNLTGSQTLRRNTIAGVLIAMHSLMGANQNNGVIATSGPFKDYKTGILLDLKYYYNPLQYSGVTPDSSVVAKLMETHNVVSGTTFAPININSSWGYIGVTKSVTTAAAVGTTPAVTQNVYTSGSPVTTTTAAVGTLGQPGYVPKTTTSAGTLTTNGSTAPKNNQLFTTTTTGTGATATNTYNTNIDYPVSGIFISNNTLHAIYLTLMARDNWIKNQLIYLNYL